MVSVMGWIQVSQLSMFRLSPSFKGTHERNALEIHPLSTTDTVALYLHCAIFTILAVLSLFG
jgi:hypothetical protein